MHTRISKQGLLWLGLSLFPSNALAQGATIIHTPDNALTPLTLDEIFHLETNLVSNLAGLNAQYLGISMSAIFGFIALFAALFYFISVKPLQEDLKESKQKLAGLEKKINEKLIESKEEIIDQLLAIDVRFSETEKKYLEKITEIKKEIFTNFSQLRDDAFSRIDASEKTSSEENKKMRAEIEEKIDNKVNLAEIKINEIISTTKTETAKIRAQAEDLELTALWNKHYVWSGQNVLTNELRALLDYIELGIKYKKTYLFELALESIDDCLGKMENKEIMPENKREWNLRINKTLSVVEGHDEEKKTILEKSGRLFKD